LLFFVALARAYPRSLSMTEAFSNGLRCPVGKRVTAASFQTPQTSLQMAGMRTPLEVMNLQLQADYGVNKQLFLGWFLAATPVFVVGLSGSFQLLQHGRLTYAMQEQSQLYSDLKLISHVPLAAFVMIDPLVRNSSMAVSVQQMAQLRSYLSLFAATSADVCERSLTSKQLQNAFAILNATEMLIANVLASGQINQTVLNAYAQAVLPAVLQNIFDVALDYLVRLDAWTASVRSTFTRAENDTCLMIQFGGHMPRQGLMSVQYFETALNTTEGARVVYCEGLTDLRSCLDLLATHLMDEAVGMAFFNSEQRMHRDLLADSATQILRQNANLFHFQ